MIHLLKDPKGETVLHPSSTGGTKRDTGIGVVDNMDEVAGLKQQVMELEKKLAEVYLCWFLTKGVNFCHSRLMRRIEERRSCTINL